MLPPRPPQQKSAKRRGEAHAALLATTAEPRKGEQRHLPTAPIDDSEAHQRGLPKKRGSDRKMPPELVDDMILGTATSALFCGYSEKHWRDLVKNQEAPQPIRFSARRLGWRVRDLKNWIAQKEAAE